MICSQSSTAPLPIATPNSLDNLTIIPSPCHNNEDSVELHVVFFPADTFPLAKSFWQHTGDGISSRMAEKCLEFLGLRPEISQPPGTPPGSRPAVGAQPSSVGSRYGRGHLRTVPASNRKVDSTATRAAKSAGSSTAPRSEPEIEGDNLTRDHANYLEERYGRSLPLSSYSVAKRALRRRIAGVLLRDSNSPSDPVEALGGAQADVGESWRGVRNVSEDDVFLYPTGMSAIWHAHQLALGTAEKMGKGAGKSVCFG